ncbi:MAG TPA: winged helix-turn-helix transcriptional regulator [Nitrososphaerales archaeon]|nr:winged helix-turn-helix transcriptional regulator [Nitrososphaerales archaeon]
MASENDEGGSGEEPDKKTQIFDLIKAHPGIHLREIQREMSVTMGTIQYHLYNLEKERKIVSRSRFGYKRFYANFVFGDSQIDVLDILAQDVEREVILYLIGNPGSSQKALCEHCNLSPATIDWHIKKLQKAGFLESTREGGYVKYALTFDQAEVLELVRSYHPSIWERWANRLADLLTEASGIEKGRHEK